MPKHKIKSVDSLPNFPALEQALLKQWYSDGTIDKYLHKNDQAKKKFFFQDGPITANNPMGVHHAWGRSYKDLWQRYKNARGYKQRFQNGFDCQGLWVEVEVEKELGFKNKKDIEKFGIAKFIKLCKERVLKFSSIQTDQSKRLGYFMDWDNSYFTMSDENNYMIWHFLKRCHQQGYIYKGHDSVPWCPRCGTAISQHEMLTEDYKEAVHESVFFKLPLLEQDFSLLVWTTTPWTIPANVAAAIHPDFTYAVWQAENGEKLLFLDSGDFEASLSPANRVLSFLGQGYRKIKDIKGKELLGQKYTGPFDHLPAVQKAQQTYPDTFHTIIAAKDLVTPHEGTGIVHIAPGAGTEDFALSRSEKLAVIAPIDEDGSYVEGFDFLSGKNAKKHPELILDYLKEKNFSLATHHYKHRYPACWRCKTELMWRVVDEWYIGMDNGQKPLRSRLKKVAHQVNWIPDFGLDRELDWLNNMHDWLISKKRYWGLALPIWVCPDCQQFEVIGGFDELKERAIEGWEKFEGQSPHRPYIDGVKIKCSHCAGTMSRIPDVGNPWLDAGIVPFSTLVDPKTKKVSYITDKKYWQDWFPADFVTESFPGQFKNWFYSLLTMSTVLEDTTPFKNLLGFASLLAEDGRPMHKSWGNSIEFNEAADKIGSDVMRWIYARHNPERNLLFGYRLADDVRRRFHMILWNSYRFYANYAALEAFTPTQVVASTELDRWIISRLNQVVDKATQSLDRFDAFSAANAVEDFVTDFSTWYIRRSRDRVGPTAPDKADKEVCMNLLHHILLTLSQLLMPIQPFISDIIYRNLTGTTVHLCDWPLTDQQAINPQLEAEMTLVRQIVEQGHAARKQASLPVRQPLAGLTITHAQEITSPDLLQLIKDELNIETVSFKSGKQLGILLDIKLTPDLIAKGQARDLIRQLQEARKEAQLPLDEQVDATLPDWPKDQEANIKRQALIRQLTHGPKLALTRLLA